MDRENMFINEYNIATNNGASEQMHKYFFTPILDNSVDQSGPFESSLSSMVSSPTTSNAAAAPPPPHGGFTNDNIVFKELIERLGSIYNSGEVSPHSYMNLNNSTNTSCYSTPMNSPPKLNLSMMDHQIRGSLTTLPFPGSHFPAQSSLTQLTTDPGFAERAAKYSCFADKNLAGVHDSELQQSIENKMDYSGKLSRVSSNQSLMKASGSQMNNGQENKDGDQNSSVSEQNGQNDMHSRKRKSSSKGKGKDAHPAKEANDVSENNELCAKRSKSDETENENPEDGKSKGEEIGTDNSAVSGNKKQGKGNKKASDSEPPKDYIHVRARRGQATDAHSLAERVRREKISQKMKLLQDLVPGCNKVTGKAVMLDEIINYVQSLQRQVEFLSMKLATIDPRMDVNLEGLLPKEMFQSCESVPNSNYALNNSAPPYPFPFQSQQVPNLHINAVLGPNMQLPSVEINKGNSSQGGTFFEDDLQSMIFGQNEAHNFHGVMPTGHMKVEL